jgi:hypothetical protein
MSNRYLLGLNVKYKWLKYMRTGLALSYSQEEECHDLGPKILRPEFLYSFDGAQLISRDHQCYKRG